MGCMCPTKEEGPGGVRGGGGGRKGKTFFVYMRGIGWGPRLIV